MRTSVGEASWRIEPSAFAASKRAVMEAITRP
jgi:hypothetical protein